VSSAAQQKGSSLFEGQGFCRIGRDAACRAPARTAANDSERRASAARRLRPARPWGPQISRQCKKRSCRFDREAAACGAFRKPVRALLRREKMPEIEGLRTAHFARRGKKSVRSGERPERSCEKCKSHNYFRLFDCLFNVSKLLSLKTNLST